MRTGTSPKRVSTPTRDRKTVTRRLQEGESFSEVFNLRGGALHVLTTDGWGDIDAVTIELSDQQGRTIAPEVDNNDPALYFAAPADGLYILKITMESLSWGRKSARLKTTLRELPAPTLATGLA
jgi:hypothetical protein